MAEHGRVTSTMLDFAFRIAVFDRMQDCENGHVREHDESMIADISRPMSMYAKAGRGPLSKTSHYPRLKHQCRNGGCHDSNWGRYRTKCQRFEP